ncbi:hypothetical protein PCURB6_31920 [Paenibacillus curdlanolyticus]|nr:hypothetical protein PCURB6_31920 [Paenibacillus curdlanolyticus]
MKKVKARIEINMYKIIPHNYTGFNNGDAYYYAFIYIYSIDKAEYFHGD